MGKEYKQNMEMVYQAVKDTMGQVIVYDGRLIIPVSHAVSIGVTVSAEELYGTAIPYLVSVDSDQDIQSPEFSSTKIYSALRIKKEFGMNGEGKRSTDRKIWVRPAWMVKKQIRDGWFSTERGTGSGCGCTDCA